MRSLWTFQPFPVFRDGFMSRLSPPTGISPLPHGIPLSSIGLPAIFRNNTPVKGNKTLWLL
jgi:hypothetical protein